MKRSFIFILILWSGSFTLAGQEKKESFPGQLQADTVVRAWSAAHNDWDLKGLDRLYAPTVFFFCEEMSSRACINKFAGILKPSDPYEHKIVSDVRITGLQNGFVRCDFDKEVISKNGSATSSSYLILKKQGERALIVAEGEAGTESKMNRRLEVGQNILVKEIVTTSAGPPAVEEKTDLKIYYLVGAAVLILGLILFFIFKKKKFVGPEVKLPIVMAPSQSAAPVKTSDVPAATRFSQTNKGDGAEFKNFVLQKFDETYFKLIDWLANKESGFFQKGEQGPEMLFEFNYREAMDRFAVECKYRNGMVGETVEIAKSRQLKAYKSFGEQHQVKVFIVLGLGGSPQSPSELFIIPVDDTSGEKMPYDWVKKYARSTNIRFFYNPQTHKLS